MHDALLRLSAAVDVQYSASDTARTRARKKHGTCGNFFGKTVATQGDIALHAET